MRVGGRFIDEHAYSDRHGEAVYIEVSEDRMLCLYESGEVKMRKGMFRTYNEVADTKLITTEDLRKAVLRMFK